MSQHDLEPSGDGEDIVNTIRELRARQKTPRLGILRRIGRRGAALLFFAFLDLVYSLSLLSPPAEARNNPSFRYIAAIAPLKFWAVLWGIGFLACLFYAFRFSDRVGFAVAIAIKVLWGVLYLIGWMFFGLDRGYVSAAIWLSLAGWIAIISTWPDISRDVLSGGTGGSRRG
jgi:hypothetical protein